MPTVKHTHTNDGEVETIECNATRTLANGDVQILTPGGALIETIPEEHVVRNSLFPTNWLED